VKAIKELLASAIVQTATAWRRLIWSWRLGALGPGSRLYPYVRIYSPRLVRLGRDVVLNDFVHIWGAGGVTIGDDTLIAAHSVITSQSHDIDAGGKGLLYRETNANKAVTIGRNVWIGSNVTIVPGVTIGDNSVVAAGAVVTRDVPAHALVAGVPARTVRMLAEGPTR
jgi:acetyltransferase-like isoleucine patch superfamily enzyme